MNSFAALLYMSLTHFADVVTWWQAEPSWHVCTADKTHDYFFKLQPRALRVLMRYGLLKQHAALRREAAVREDNDCFLALEPTLATFLLEAHMHSQVPSALPEIFSGADVSCFVDFLWRKGSSQDVDAALALHYVESVSRLGMKAQTALKDAACEYRNKAWLSGAVLMQDPYVLPHERLSWYALPFLVKHATAATLTTIVARGHFASLGRVLKKFRGGVIACLHGHSKAQAEQQLCWQCQLLHCASLDYKMSVGVMAMCKLNEHHGIRKHRRSMTARTFPSVVVNCESQRLFLRALAQWFQCPGFAAKPHDCDKLMELAVLPRSHGFCVRTEHEM